MGERRGRPLFALLLCMAVACVLPGCGYVESVTDTMSDGISGAVDAVDFWSGDEPAAANATGGAQTARKQDGQESEQQAAQEPAPVPQAPDGAASAVDAGGASGGGAGMALGRKYWYYPDDRIYFDPLTSTYFYWDKGEWVRSATLPENMRKLLGDHVVIVEESAAPYERNREHMNEYPPDQVRVRPPASGGW